MELRLPSPIVNFSQEACGIPIDTVPPCIPTLSITNDCLNNITNNAIVNKISWNNPDDICGISGDTKGFRIYVKHEQSSTPELIYETNDPQQLYLEYASEEYDAEGCFYIVAFDSVFNESPPSNIVCMKNCPDYRLPNAFSPNNDGHNDVFRPYPYRFVHKVEFKIYNRWGNIIFETSDPDINWKGENQHGKNVPDGTYYYSCKVFETNNSGVGVDNPLNLTGFIELIR
jgi:gliding motility-associated-like protein